MQAKLLQLWCWLRAASGLRSVCRNPGPPSTEPETAEDAGLTAAEKRDAWALIWPAQESPEGRDHFAGCPWLSLEFPQTPPEDVAWSLGGNMAAAKSERTIYAFSKSPPSRPQLTTEGVWVRLQSACQSNNRTVSGPGGRQVGCLRNFLAGLEK